MSLIDRLKALDVDDILGFLVKALDTIGVLARSANPGTAADAIQAIRHIYDVIDDVSNAKITPEDAEKELQALLDGVAANDEKADAALDEKFDSSEDTDPGQDTKSLDDADSEE